MGKAAGRPVRTGRGRFPGTALAVLLLAGTAVVAVHDWIARAAGSTSLSTGPLRRRRDRRRGRLPPPRLGLRSRTVRLEPDRPLDPLLGRRRDLLDGRDRWERLRAVPLAGRHRLPAFYPLAYAGIVLLVRARAYEMNWRLWMDGAIAALGTAALGTAFIFDFVAGKATGTGLEVATTLAYPLGDIGMLSLVVGVVALTGWRPGRTWSLLLAGLSALVIADIAYTLQTTDASLPAAANGSTRST